MRCGRQPSYPKGIPCRDSRGQTSQVMYRATGIPRDRLRSTILVLWMSCCMTDKRRTNQRSHGWCCGLLISCKNFMDELHLDRSACGFSSQIKKPVFICGHLGGDGDRSPALKGIEEGQARPGRRTKRVSHLPASSI